MEHLFSTTDTEGYGMLDAADKRGAKNRYIDHLQKLALERADVFKPGNVVLDFGCGVGRLSVWLAQQGCKVYGIDVGTDLLCLAKTYNAHANLEYQLFDGETIAFSEGSFDAILCVRILNRRILPDQKLAPMIAEFDRVLKASGIVVALEPVYGREHPLCYRREELLSTFEHYGFICPTSYPIRKGHWPILYLMRWGLIPPKFFQRLAWYELEKRRHEAEALLDYKDYLFCFEKKG
jgi:SAM-dependent methyltransferase